MTLQEYRKKKKKNKKTISNLLNKVLLLIIIIFILMIVINFNPELKNKVKNKLFKTDYNFSYLNKVYDKYFASIFNEKEKTKKVSKEHHITKEKYNDGLKIYLNNTSDVINKKSGIVVYIGKKDGYDNTIVIQQSNGIDAWYGNIEESSVKLYDYVEEGNILGKANDYYFLVYEKNKKKITYEEANKD